MVLSTFQWHQRYSQQAEWTRNIRRDIYSRFGIDRISKVLDIGCGTGVLEREFETLTSLKLFGVDISHDHLRFAQGYAPGSIYAQGDCLHLPFSARVFDACLFHYFLLWIKEPLLALEELVKVTRPSGYVIALAEPDYAGRIDFPPELSMLGKWQSEALEVQGANPNIGRSLRSLFHRVGLVEVEVGVLGGQWSDHSLNDEHEKEWEVVENDLSKNDDYLMQLGRLREIDRTAYDSLERILFVPTFYAVGKVPGMPQSEVG